MKFHGRISPGKITDLSTPLQVLIYAPAKLSGVTIKIWEMDTFEQDGKTKSEGTADDLLATFQGDITPADAKGARPPEWRAFKVSSAKIEPPDPGADQVMVKLQFGGSDTIYEVPIKSELDEVEGDSYEIGFSIEVGGAEKFKTKSPALVVPPMTPLRVVARYIQSLRHEDAARVDKDSTYDEPLAYRYVALGTPTTDDENAKFKILGTGFTDGQGYLFDGELDPKADKPPRPMIVRAGRGLFILDNHEPFKKIGATEIPIVRCNPVLPDDHDLVVIRSGVTHPMSMRIAERPSVGEERFGEAKVEVPEQLPPMRFTVVSKKAGPS